jgi:hypothetical protein
MPLTAAQKAKLQADAAALTAQVGALVADAPAPAPAPAPSPPPAPAPSPAPAPPPATSLVAWQIPDAGTLSTAAGRIETLATVPAGAVAYASPDLLPGQRLSLAGGTLSLVNDATVPAADRRRATVIEVMDSEQATAKILRTGELFGAGQPGAYAHIQFAMDRMQDGDILEISPGAIWVGNGDGSQYLEAAMFHVWKSCTIRNMPGRGRWRLAPSTVAYADGWGGIVIREPNQSYSDVDNHSTANPRKVIVIEGFEASNWGRNGDDNGVKMRTMGSDGRTFNHMHASVTFRNFKVGKAPYIPSASGISGAAETMTLEDGWIYDTGGGINANPGNDHNAYVSARTLTLRGVRMSRTRGASADGSVTMDGHMLKASAVNALIEGCAFDATPQGDMTHLIQAKAGGNFVIRSTLFGDSINNQSQGRGMINMCRELAGDGVTPNFEWWAGLEGNSLLVERCVFVGHYGRPCVHFFPQGHSYAIPAAQVSSVTVRDNVGMLPATPTVLAPFDSTKWIANDPKSGPAWSANNTVVPYDPTEAAFLNRALKGYGLAVPVSAAAALAMQRFVYPHGFEPRSDNLRGLG